MDKSSWATVALISVAEFKIRATWTPGHRQDTPWGCPDVFERRVLTSARARVEKVLMCTRVCTSVCIHVYVANESEQSHILLASGFFLWSKLLLPVSPWPTCDCQKKRRKKKNRLRGWGSNSGSTTWSCDFRQLFQLLCDSISRNEC